MVNNLSAMQETQAQFLGQENPLEPGMATRSSVLQFTATWFVTQVKITQDVVCCAKCSTYTWEESVFFCIWTDCPENIR